MADNTTTDLSDVGTHSRNVTAFFDTQDMADKARTDLVSAGVSPDAISVVGGMNSGAASTDEGGFWHALKEFFVPDEDRYTYAEGLRRGGFALSVKTDDTTYDRAMDILDADGAVDIDEREKSWRSEGWEGYSNATNPVADTIAYARAEAGTAGFGASLAGDGGYAPHAPLTQAGTAETEALADTGRVGSTAGSPGLLNPDMRERIGSGTASMTPPTPTGSQDATLNDNAANIDRSSASYAAAADAEDAALGSPTRSGMESSAVRSTIGSMKSAAAESSLARDGANTFRRDDAVQRSRVRGYVRDPLDEDRNGTL